MEGRRFRTHEQALDFQIVRLSAVRWLAVPLTSESPNRILEWQDNGGHLANGLDAQIPLPGRLAGQHPHRRAVQDEEYALLGCIPASARAADLRAIVTCSC